MHWNLAQVAVITSRLACAGAREFGVTTAFVVSKLEKNFTKIENQLRSYNSTRSNPAQRPFLLSKNLASQRFPWTPTTWEGPVLAKGLTTETDCQETGYANVLFLCAVTQLPILFPRLTRVFYFLFAPIQSQGSTASSFYGSDGKGRRLSRHAVISSVRVGRGRLPIFGAVSF